MISVIIPSYNSESTLRETLSSLRNQTIPGDRFEVIVVDDGSTDNSVKAAEDNVDVLLRQDHAGPAAARNRGAKAAKGDILVFTDSDCIPAPDWLEKLCNPFVNPDVIAVKGAYRTKQKGIIPRFAQVEFEERYRKLLNYSRIDFVDSYSAAIRRSAFKEVGGFDLRFPAANNEDVDLSYKLAARGYLMVFAPEAIIYHQHPSSLKSYLRTKFLRAYWRAMVYSRHPAKLMADSYTPQLLKLQTALGPAFLLLLALTILNVVSLWIPCAVLMAMMISSFPLIGTAIKKDRGIILFVIPGAILRAFALGLGAATGALSHRQKDLFIPLLLLLADGLAFLLSLLGAFYLRSSVLSEVFNPFVHSIDTYTRPLPLVLALWLGSFAYLNLYATKIHTTPFVEFVRVLKGSIFSLLVIMSLSFLVKFDYSRFLILVFFVIVVPATAIFRSLVRHLHHRLLREGYRSARCIVVGCGEMASNLLANMLTYPALGCKPVGIVSREPPADEDSLPLPWVGKAENIAQVAVSLGVDDVFLADPSFTPLETMALALACDSAGASCKVVSGFTRVVANGEGITSLGHLPVVDLSRSKPGPVHGVIKEFLDFTVAFSILLLLSPLLSICFLVTLACGVKPFWVVEERIGRGGRLFRTSKLNTESATCFIIRSLRKSGLDRLPRLLAVLKGDMSLVGPRGEPPGVVANNPPWERLLLEAKPGLTGLWLVGRAGDIYHGSEVEYDFYYLRNRSLLLDFVILLRTIPAVWRIERKQT